MRIIDWSSDVCSSDLRRDKGICRAARAHLPSGCRCRDCGGRYQIQLGGISGGRRRAVRILCTDAVPLSDAGHETTVDDRRMDGCGDRSEEHTSELQSLMRISYAVFCLKKKKENT